MQQRDRFIDGLRALAILGVVGGHWLVGALVATPGGGLRIDSPLRYLESLHPVTWFLQMLGLFFLVGGFTAAQGLRRARARGDTDAEWVRRRLWRIGRPVVAATVILAVALPLLGVLGLGSATARSTVVLFLQPLWFMAVYAVITALTPYALSLDRRAGLRVVVALAAVVAVVDLARFGPEVEPVAVGYLSVLPAWCLPYQLGVAWSAGRLDRRVAGALLAGGLALFVFLLAGLEYPVSIVSVPGSTRSNSNPPSLLVPALAAIQAGAALLLRDRIERLLRRPRIWTAVAALNLSAMSVFCWHQVRLSESRRSPAGSARCRASVTRPSRWAGSPPASPGTRCSPSSWPASSCWCAATSTRCPSSRSSGPEAVGTPCGRPGVHREGRGPDRSTAEAGDQDARRFPAQVPVSPRPGGYRFLGRSDRPGVTRPAS
ncbi:acyltransferase [Micromonospora sp. WMMD1102]|uniref:acyltransferase family protein n=1 Tax=Micromonospora sp. WMMD1102 TaxID=3016105 RepID=UPI0024153232|nr:acyltransferase [Micromonospora sp. WMMD1102]MDG4787201.1 acyltransferase [Micromonospora sp. WMMD1102]